MRAFEEACLAGVPTREIHGELHLGVGQEAIAAGMIPHLRRQDGLVSTHRNHLHALAKGVSPHALMAEIFEKESGICHGRGGHMHPFDTEHNFSATGIVGASLPVALGFAYAASMEGTSSVGVGITGDGGANHGTFHECMNMAGAWKLPLIVLVENNAYAISVRAEDVTAPIAHWRRAKAYGAHGISVDGTNVEAVDLVLAEAFDHARSGSGPVVVEAFCQRFRGHYEGDADTYRPRNERRRMRQDADPLTIAHQKLEDNGVSRSALDQIQLTAKAEMAEILDAVRSERSPSPSGALDYLFVNVAGRSAR